MLRWYVFTIAMGLLPFGFSVLLQTLRGVPPAEWQSSPELLFFSMLVSAAQLDGAFTARAEPQNGHDGWPALLGAMFGCFLVTSILSAALYGVYVDHARDDPARGAGSTCEMVVRYAGGTRYPDEVRHRCGEWLDFQANLFTLSTWMSCAVGVAGTLAEWARTRRQR